MGCRIRIPKLGWVRMRESLRFTGKILSATISRVAERWFVSITVDTPDNPHLPKAENQGAVGVDLGVSALATLSTGETIPCPKPHKALLARLRRLSKSLSRKGSANRRKAKAKLAKLHARIAAIRQDALRKLTTDVTRRFHTIGIEDLNVRGMMANRHLARCRHELLRVPAAVGVQNGDAGWTGGGGRPLLCQQQDLLGLRSHAGDATACGASVDLPGLWRDPRPRRECGDQPEEHGREFHGVSLWRGRLWLDAQASGETGLDEAASQLCCCLSRNE
jgi:hypothetical protein